MKIRLLHLMTFVFAALLITACGKKKWDKTVTIPVQYQISADSLNVAGNPFVLDIAELQFEDFRIEGERLQSTPIAITKQNKQSIDFLSGEWNKGFEIPIGTYTSMRMHTHLVAPQSPSIHLSGKYAFNAGPIVRINIVLNLEEDYLIDILDVDQSDTILITEDSNKKLKVYLDLAELFSDITLNSLTNGNFTFQDGEFTMEINDVENSGIKKAIEDHVKESLVIGFVE